MLCSKASHNSISLGIVTCLLRDYADLLSSRLTILLSNRNDRSLSILLYKLKRTDGQLAVNNGSSPLDVLLHFVVQHGEHTVLEVERSTELGGDVLEVDDGSEGGLGFGLGKDDDFRGCSGVEHLLDDGPDGAEVVWGVGNLRTTKLEFL